MKATQHIILATILFWSLGTQGVKAQQTEDPAKEQVKVEIGCHIGQEAPEIVFESPEGESIALSSLRGQMVLIDFWGAWCPPCRRENPNLVDVYRRYKDKEFVNASGFTIYSVSLDKNRDRWIAAIEQDSLEWGSHVNDLTGMKTSAAWDYEFSSIPVNFLLDGNGIILAVGLRGSYLEKKLKEYLK
jgi:thiol-disulfide isomerase/thioredoxin